MLKSSIRNDLLVLVMIITFITIVVGNAIVTMFGIDYLKNRQVEEAKIIAQLTADNLTSALAFSDEQGAEEVLALLKTMDKIECALVYDKEQHIFADYCRLGYSLVSLTTNLSENLEYIDSSLVLTHRIYLEKELIGYLKINFSLQEFHSLLQSLIIKLIFVSIFLLALGFLLALRLQKRITTPISQLTKAMQDIQAKEKIDVDVNIDSKNEIGILAQEFNTMITILNQKSSERDVAIESALESEMKYKDLVDFIPLTLFECDEEGKISYLNKHGCDTFGFSSNTLSSANFLDLFKPKEQAEAKKKLLTTFLSKTDVSFEAQAVDRLNNSIFVLCYIHYLKDKNQTIARGIILDITQRKTAEKNLVQAQKMETIGRLAGGIAHDFNNVLGGILGTLSISELYLQKSPIDSEKIKEMTSLALESTSRATDLVKQILTLSRQTETEHRPYDIRNALQHVRKICQNTFSKSVELQFDTGTKKAMSEGDQTQVEQVLLNLAVNASHAMTFMRPPHEKEGGILRVELKQIFADETFCRTHLEAERKHYWLLSIQDNGVGMSNKTLSKIFDPFFTTKDKEKGTGLGLSTVYNIVKQHNGFLYVYSELNVGTTFNVYLPFLEEFEYDEEKNENLIVQYKGSETILVMDDEKIIRRVIEEALGKCGYNLIFASDGEKGMQRFHEQKDAIDLVIADMAMPKKSGKDCYYEIKKVKPNQKFILTSGFKQDNRVLELIDNGIEGFLQKPFAMKDLIEIVHNTLHLENKISK